MFTTDNSSIKIIDFRSNNRQARNFSVTNVFKNLMISNIYRFIVRLYLDRKTDFLLISGGIKANPFPQIRFTLQVKLDDDPLCISPVDSEYWEKTNNEIFPFELGIRVGNHSIFQKTSDPKNDGFSPCLLQIQSDFMTVVVPHFSFSYFFFGPKKLGASNTCFLVGFLLTSSLCEILTGGVCVKCIADDACAVAVLWVSDALLMFDEMLNVDKRSTNGSCGCSSL